MATEGARQLRLAAKTILRTKALPACSSAVSSSLAHKDYVGTRSQSNLAAFKRGRGGRSSFSGIVATVFGANGFLGRHVVTELGKCGSQVIVPYRRDSTEVRDLKLCGDLGQILFHPFNLKDEDSVRAAIKHSNVVINLIGKINETRNFSFDDALHQGPRLIARLSREMDVSRLIHVSAMNSSPDPQPVLTNGSKFLIAKSLGETAVMEEFPNATIMRPSDMFGHMDRFSTYYVHKYRRMGSMIPLWKGGRKTVKQPVFVQDVSKGIINTLYDKESVGKTFECVGPKRYYLRDIIDHYYQAIRWSPRIQAVPMNPLYLGRVAAEDLIRKDPFTSTDKVEREFITDQLTGCPTLEDLGVELVTLDSRTNKDVSHYRVMGHQEQYINMFGEPEPPITAEERDAMNTDPSRVYY